MNDSSTSQESTGDFETLDSKIVGDIMKILHGKRAFNEEERAQKAVKVTHWDKNRMDDL